MRSLMLLAALSTTGISGERRPLVLKPAPREIEHKGKNLVERILEPFDGGGMNGFAHADRTVRKSEDPLGTLTLRWVLHFW